MGQHKLVRARGNREVSEVIGLSDQGQMSRMMKRLSSQGLVENTQARTKRLARSWRLTADGEAVIDAQRKVSKGGKLVPKSSGRRGRRQQIAHAGDETVDIGLRLTALTHQVVTAVASLSEQVSNPNNREIAHAVKVKDEGQISKPLARLQAHGLLENTGGASPAAGNAWQLTGRGEELLHASRPFSHDNRGAFVPFSKGAITDV